MKSKLTKEDYEKINQGIKDFAKKSVFDLFNSKLPIVNRIKNGFLGISLYGFFAGVWFIRNYRWIKEYLKLRFNIEIKWVILVILFAWILAGLIYNASHN